MKKKKVIEEVFKRYYLYLSADCPWTLSEDDKALMTEMRKVVKGLDSFVEEECR